MASARRERARRGEGDRLRDELLDAAEALLLRTGDADAVSIRAIGDAVGVSPPAIYMHFADKDDLVWRVCERAFVRLDGWLEENTARADDPIGALHALGRAYVRFGLEHPEQYRVLFMSRPQRAPDGFDWATAPSFACFMRVVGLVEQATADGRIREGDAFEAALVLWSGVHGLTSALLSTPQGFPWPEDRDALVDSMLRTLVAGLAPVSPARPTQRAAPPRARR